MRAALPSQAPLEAPAACLGLESLPTRIARLSPGMTYSLACDQQAVRLPLAARALAASLATGKICALVTPGDPTMYLRKVQLAGLDLGRYARTGALTLLQLTEDAEKHLFRAGPGGFLRQLEAALPPSGALVVLDQADALFMLSDSRASADAAQSYLRWMHAHQHTLLALFAPNAMAPREYLALRRAAENFAGFAVARSTYGGGTLDVKHWFTAEGASPRETFGLNLHGQGPLHAPNPNAGKDELPPAAAIICVQGALHAVKAQSKDWEEVASCAEAVRAARRSDTATLVLPFRHNEDFASLCHIVAAVRALARPELHVVVRECERRLRNVQALALMRLGVTALIPRDVSDPAARRLVDLLKGTRFARAHDSDLEQVLDETKHLFSAPAGNSALFCEAVESWLAVAEDFGFESCLVRLEVAATARRRVLARARGGIRDVIALERGSELWLFLFSCPEAALAAVVQRLQAADAPPPKWSAEYSANRILGALEALRAP